MAYELSAEAMVAAASGVALLILGSSILLLRPRTAPTISFSLFALLWGLVVVAGNVGDMAEDARTFDPWFSALIVLSLVLYAPLLHFVATYPAPVVPALKRPATGSLFWAPGALLVLTFLVAPDLFIERLDETPDGGVVPVRGVLFDPALNLTTVAVFVVALGMTAWRLARTPQVTLRAQLALVVAGFLFFVSYRAADLIATDPGQFIAERGLSNYVQRTIVRAAALAVVVAVLAYAVRRRDCPWRRTILAAGTLPFVAGALGADLGVPGFHDTVGLWRLALVALFAYAIARYRLFDLDVRLKWSLGRSTIAAIFIGVFFLASEGAEALVESRTGSALMGLVAATVLLVFHTPLQRLVDRVLDRAMPRVGDTPDYALGRKVEVYRGVLESVWKDGVATEKERANLARLRNELGLRQEDADTLEREVRAERGVP